MTSQLPKYVYDVCRFGLADEITVVNTYFQFVDLFWCQNTTNKNWHLQKPQQTLLANTTIGQVILFKKKKLAAGCCWVKTNQLMCALETLEYMLSSICG